MRLEWPNALEVERQMMGILWGHNKFMVAFTKKSEREDFYYIHVYESWDSAREGIRAFVVPEDVGQLWIGVQREYDKYKGRILEVLDSKSPYLGSPLYRTADHASLIHVIFEHDPVPVA